MDQHTTVNAIRCADSWTQADSLSPAADFVIQDSRMIKVNQLVKNKKKQDVPRIYVDH